MVFAASLGGVHGVVHDAQHRPVAAARVELQAAGSAWAVETRSSAAGEFSFPAVPAGDYVLSISQSSFATAVVQLTVTSGPSPSTHVQLSAGAPAQTITVSATAPPNAETFTPTTLLDRSSIALTPGADRTNSLAIITDYVPGAYIVHDQLHVRGGHQVTWEVDGVEIPNTNIASNLGPTIDPKDIDYMEVERGSYAADEGDRTYGVFNIVPRTGFERNSEGDLTVSGGNFDQTNDALSVGGHSNQSAYYASVNANRSKLGLMTPAEQVIHDAADGYGGFTTLVHNLNAGDQLRLISSARRDDYQIPNTPGQIAADVQRESDAYTIFSWVHALPSSATLTSSLFYHYNRADLDGGAGDFPISTTNQHASSYFGAEESVRVSAGRHELAAGLVGFGQNDDQDFKVEFKDGSNPAIAQSVRLAGSVSAAYFQDTVKVFRWLTLSGGVRQTHFRGVLTENATDPRLGGTVKLPGTNWVLHTFWGKFYQAPPLATLSGPLLALAPRGRVGFLPLHGERDREFQYGLTIPMAGWTLDIDHFRTAAQNFFDHNPLGNSDVFLPLTIAGALIRATELTLRSPRSWASVHAHLAYSNQSADGIGAVSGGLTNFAPTAGFYALDHDQRNTFNAGIDWQLRARAYASLNLYYGSGFANSGGPPSHLPSHVNLDVSLGKAFSKIVTASVTILNVTQRHLLVDNSVTFDGMHWNNPREVYAELHYKFGY